MSNKNETLKIVVNKIFVTSGSDSEPDVIKKLVTDNRSYLEEICQQFDEKVMRKYLNPQPPNKEQDQQYTKKGP